ncbi:hypothetical protein IA539_13075 [Gordonia sp. zg691]|uniref:hypothetical protein n=1 Tax=Gordonia jinghuaiqii TaxID=2758710 RepID=UPI00166239A1|nr:hypothetical protein [Gordonia jinghuaiqii]MBD0862140.1 hypothetical protein [Gordonia jinghuaiqii]
MGIGDIRRRVSGLAVAAGCVLALTALTPGSACACSCAQIPVEKTIAQAPAVVVGTVVDTASHGSGTRYTVDVERSYKKQLPSRVTVVTASTGGACGISLSEGVRSVVVLGWPGGGVETGPGEWGASLCSNLEVSPADVDRIAGPAFDPAPGAAPMPNDSATPTGSGWLVGGGIAVGVGLLAAAVAAVAGAGRRRRR